MYSEHFDKTVSDCQDRDGAKASLFNFTTHLQRVSLSSLDYKDFIAYHKTVDWLAYIFLSFLANCKQDNASLKESWRKPVLCISKGLNLHSLMLYL